MAKGAPNTFSTSNSKTSEFTYQLISNELFKYQVWTNILLLNIMFRALMGRFQLLLFYLFLHRRPTRKLCFFCRPFVVTATFSTGLVVSSVSWLVQLTVKENTICEWDDGGKIGKIYLNILLLLYSPLEVLLHKYIILSFFTSVILNCKEANKAVNESAALLIY